MFQKGIYRKRLVGLVQQGDAVDPQVEVRSGTILGLVEVAVGDDLGVGGVVGIGVTSA